MKRGLALLVPLAAALTIGLSACGSGSTTTSTLPGDPVSKAAAATMNAHGARVAIDMKMDIESVGQPFHMTGGGVVDASKRQAQLDLDMSDIGNLPGGDQLGAASKLKMRELLDGFTLYMSAPFLTENLPGGKKWLKMDIQKVGQAAGFSLGAFQQPGQGDPSQWIQFLRSASQMKKVGTDIVRGVETTHYKGVSNLDKLPEMVPPADRKAARATTDQLTKLTGITSVPVEAWLDSKGLVRRVKMSLDYKQLPGSDQGMSVDLTEELYDFGAKVDATPPPADETYDITKLATKTIQQNGLGS
jgi:hypothetical protein